MKTIETKVYEYYELSDDAKEKARQWYKSTDFGDEWWEPDYEDAKTVGLKLEYFGLDRNRHATGEFIISAIDCALKIENEHGDKTETYKTARTFINETRKMDSDSAEYEDACDEFRRSILEDYSIILQKDYEYTMSDEYVMEAIEANGYTFTIDGKRFG